MALFYLLIDSFDDGRINPLVCTWIFQPNLTKGKEHTTVARPCFSFVGLPIVDLTQIVVDDLEKIQIQHRSVSLFTQWIYREPKLRFIKSHITSDHHLTSFNAEHSVSLGHFSIPIYADTRLKVPLKTFYSWYQYAGFASKKSAPVFNAWLELAHNLNGVISGISSDGRRLFTLFAVIAASGQKSLSNLAWCNKLRPIVTTV